MARRSVFARSARLSALWRAVMGVRFAVDPPAKINLHLEVLGRRGDGYHEIRTLYQSIDLFDRLTAESVPAGELTLDVEPNGQVNDGDDNLILRAARRLARATRVDAGARFRLKKRIPVAAGLGGGSADAAATLVLLNRLWECRLGGADLHRLAADLGSDVPFFLHGGLAAGFGRGDEILELPDEKEAPVVVVVPDVQVSTAEVYGSLDRRLTSHRQEGNLYPFAAGLRGRPDWRVMTNELEDAVIGIRPEVGEGLRMLRSSGPVHASLSGSGAASFAIFDRPEAAHRAAAALPGSWFVHVGTTMRRSSARLEVESDCDGGRR